MAPGMNAVLVTGANAGLGQEACRQLAAVYNVRKVILACRSKEKAAEAVRQLVKSTGKPASTFEVLQLDVSDLESCRSAVSKLETRLDGIVMNAGGMMFNGGGDITSRGSTTIFQTNVLGHTVFLEGLIEAGKLEKGCRVVYSGSEAASGIPSIGIKRPVFDAPTTDEVANYISGKAFAGANYDPNKQYPYVKSIAALYIGAMARKHTDYHFVTVSPGMTDGTNVFNDAPAPVRIFMNYFAGFILKTILGRMHGVEDGAKRYMDGLFTKELGPSGSFFASDQKKPVGPLVNQAPIYDIYANHTMQNAAYEAVHLFSK